MQSHELAILKRMVGTLVCQYPLPWRTEQDWTIEVYDKDNKLVMNCMSQAEADTLIGLANEYATDDLATKAFLKENGIE